MSISLNLDNSYAKELSDFCAQAAPERFSDTQLVYFNQPLAEELGLLEKNNLNPDDSAQLAQFFSGHALPQACTPIAQAYAGHQFGHYNPQLGDGRALIIGEQITPKGERVDLCFKGSGRTPFSRGGDGRAAIGPMLREVLIAEYMHAVGIPTTRSLAVVTTGDDVYRETALPGAILTRTASSHIRIGTFEYVARKGREPLRQLADYAINRHYPELNELESPEKYAGFLNAVCQRQAQTIAQWMGVGFIHGVMNTDNMLISGETIDYGPCAFMDTYNPDTVFSSIDRNGRYAYKNQPAIGHWDLARLAECLLQLLSDDQKQAVVIASEKLEMFQKYYEDAWLDIHSKKLGLIIDNSDQANCIARTDAIHQWLTILQDHQIDFTLSFQLLADSSESGRNKLYNLFDNEEPVRDWLKNWQPILARNSVAQSAINPSVIPRNHLVEEALEAANKNNDYASFNKLLAEFQKPYEPKEEAALNSPASAAFTSTYQTFCGT